MKLLVIIGTRPEAIKMAPLIIELQTRRDIKVELCVTAQHREMLDQVLDIFNLKPDYDLDLMTQGQDLIQVTTKIIESISKLIRKTEPDIVVVHGDTTTCFASAYAAFLNKVKIAHIEAGLRTGDLYSPWPEEGNRSLVSKITDLHFAPTRKAKQNLIKEGISENQIIVTGNTVIDSIRIISDKVILDDEFKIKFYQKFDKIDFGKRIILVTGHRRENFGDGINNICDALIKVSNAFKDTQVVYPVHLNPNILKPVQNRLHGYDRIHLIHPLDYESFVFLMSESHIILTDSGGIQEEAPYLKKPVLLTRENTERPEAEAAGTVKLVGTDTDKIFNSISKILTNTNEYNSFLSAKNPYGDGYASQLIIETMLEKL